jgi:hypothetical protein
MILSGSNKTPQAGDTSYEKLTRENSKMKKFDHRY